jgi:hypothetical protein
LIDNLTLLPASPFPRIYILVIFGIAIFLNHLKYVYGEELIFDYESVSKVELEIELYDLKINYLNVWDINKRHPCLDGIATSTLVNLKYT